MSGKPDYRDYINPTTAHSKAWQLSMLTGGTTYIEDKTGNVFVERLLGSIRKGSIVRVAAAYLLAPNKGGAAKKRDGWAARYKLLRKAGATLIVPGVTETGAALAMMASVQIANSGRGAAGLKKSGRPNKLDKLEPATRNIVEQIVAREWPSKKHETRRAAHAEINRQLKPLKVTLGWGWLYTNADKIIAKVRNG